MERSAQKMPRLPELQEMDDKQLNESLSQFYTEAPSKVAANFVFFFSELTCETASKRVSRPFCRFVMMLKVVR